MICEWGNLCNALNEQGGLLVCERARQVFHPPHRSLARVVRFGVRLRVGRKYTAGTRNDLTRGGLEQKSNPECDKARCSLSTYPPTDPPGTQWTGSERMKRTARGGAASPKATVYGSLALAANVRINHLSSIGCDACVAGWAGQFRFAGCVSPTR